MIIDADWESFHSLHFDIYGNNEVYSNNFFCSLFKECVSKKYVLWEKNIFEFIRAFVLTASWKRIILSGRG